VAAQRMSRYLSAHVCVSHALVHVLCTYGAVCIVCVVYLEEFVFGHPVKAVWKPERYAHAD